MREQLISGLDHVQVTMPRGEEARARAFYGELLGMPEIPKPATLAARGGVWFVCGAQMVHVSAEDPFQPLRKAHPALLVRDLAALRARFAAASVPMVEDDLLPGYQRFYAADPFGNRLEFLCPIVSLGVPEVGTTSAWSTEMTPAAMKERVRAMFGPAAQDYVSSVNHATGEDLRRLVELAAPRASDRALDLSTGGGHAALALAPHVRWIVASDLTPPMLAAARDHLRARDVRNAEFVIADAEHLPFLEATFDLVSVRIAPHHYADPQAALREVARVLVPGGRLLLIDNIAPEEPELDALANTWERWRDPSHVREYTVSEWRRMLATAGLAVTHVETGRKTHHFADWVARSRMSVASAANLERAMLAAPASAQLYFEFTAHAGRLLSWSAEYLIARADR